MEYVGKIMTMMAIAVCTVCLVVTPVSADSTEDYEVQQIQTRMVSTSVCGADLTITGSGIASASGYVKAKAGVDGVYVKVTLQKWSGSYWTKVAMWETSASGRNASILKTCQVSKGKYRVVVYTKAGSETKTRTSASKTY